MTRLSDHPAPYGTPRKPDPGLDFGGDEIGSVTGLPAGFNERATRAVAGRARDAEDARLPLDALGLLPTPAAEEPAQ